MKTATELTQLLSEAEHKKRATNLKQLAGKLRAQVDGIMGFDSVEAKLLAKAADLLESAAKTGLAASRLAAERKAKRDRLKEVVRAQLQPYLTRLTSVGEKVAFVGAVGNFQISLLEEYPHLSTLARQLEEATSFGVAMIFERNGETDLAQAVAKMWAKFEERKAELVARHAVLIAKLEQQQIELAKRATEQISTAAH
jgi:predicted component of type VI protein secretion system